MNTKRIIFTVLSAASLLGAASASYGQGAKSQAGGLPALAEEVASLRALVLNLQQQVEGGDPYTGTFAVTLVETAFFGCGVGLPPSPPALIPAYIVPQSISSVSTRSSSFDAEADGSVLLLPEFELFTQEMRLSGKYLTNTEVEGPIELVIGGDGSLSANLPNTEVSGHIASDGSMLSLVATGHEVVPTPGGTCTDVYTVNLTGVRK